MRAGNAAEAEKVYRADLEHNRQNPRSLFGLWKALERQGRRPRRRSEAEFDAAWAGADVTLADSDWRAKARTDRWMSGGPRAPAWPAESRFQR